MLEAFTSCFLVFTRLGALLSVLPMFSGQGLPVRLRVALSAMLAFLIAPFLPSVNVEHQTLWTLIPLIGSEVSVGLLLGFICRLLFFALEAAGNLVGTEMGLMVSSEFNPVSSGTTSTLGSVLYWMAIMIWFSLDLHHWMIAALAKSYVLVPFGGAHLSEALLVDVIRRSGSIFVLAVQISAPVMGVSFVLSLVFSLLGRAVPQMNVFTESFSVRTLAGLTVFGMTCLFMAQHILNALRQLPEDVLRVVRLLSGTS